jgi:hypothetical protein
MDGAKVPGGGWLGAVTLVRIVDGKGFDANRQHLIVDYKTAAKPWAVMLDKDGKYFAAKASGFQPVCYLIPKGKSWPRQISFLVYGGGMSVQHFRYQMRDADLDNTMRLISEIEGKWKRGDPSLFIKAVGYECERCALQNLCWKVPGWEANYARIKGSETNSGDVS